MLFIVSGNFLCSPLLPSSPPHPSLTSHLTSVDNYTHKLGRHQNMSKNL